MGVSEAQENLTADHPVTPTPAFLFVCHTSFVPANRYHPSFWLFLPSLPPSLRSPQWPHTILTWEATRRCSCFSYQRPSIRPLLSSPLSLLMPPSVPRISLSASKAGEAAKSRARPLCPRPQFVLSQAYTVLKSRPGPSAQKEGSGLVKAPTALPISFHLSLKKTERQLF